MIITLQKQLCWVTKHFAIIEGKVKVIESLTFYKSFAFYGAANAWKFPARDAFQIFLSEHKICLPPRGLYDLKSKVSPSIWQEVNFGIWISVLAIDSWG